MNWLDITLAVTFLISIVAGLNEGFAKAGIGFVASILGLVFGLQYYRPVAVSLHPYISKGTTANLVGFLIVYIGICVIGGVAAGILAKFMRELRLVWLDRALGAGFGAVRELWFGTIMIWALMAFLPVNPGHVVAGSRFAPVVMDTARRVADASPDDVKDGFRHSYHELNKVLPEKVKDRLANIQTVPGATH